MGLINRLRRSPPRALRLGVPTDRCRQHLRYIIAFLARDRAGLLDCDVVAHGAPSLCTDGAAFIRENRDRILDAYTHFADRTAATVGHEAEVLWLIEPDFHQYSAATQKGGGLCEKCGLSPTAKCRAALLPRSGSSMRRLVDVEQPSSTPFTYRLTLAASTSHPLPVPIRPHGSLHPSSPS